MTKATQLGNECDVLYSRTDNPRIGGARSFTSQWSSLPAEFWEERVSWSLRRGNLEAGQDGVGGQGLLIRPAGAVF